MLDTDLDASIDFYPANVNMVFYGKNTHPNQAVATLAKVTKMMRLWAMSARTTAAQITTL